MNWRNFAIVTGLTIAWTAIAMAKFSTPLPPYIILGGALVIGVCSSFIWPIRSDK